MDLTGSNNWVDTHFHIFHAGEAVSDARYVPQYSATLTDWRAQAGQVGVRRGVLVQPSFLGTDNRLLVQILEANPDLLRGVAVVAADTPSDALRVLHVSGVRGIRLNLAGLSHDIPEWTRADALWQTMHQLGWHVQVHTDQGGLPYVLKQLPTEIPLVVDHMAKPEQARLFDASVRALVHRATSTPTYVKLSGAYRLGPVDAAALGQIWLQALGAEALLWGSDWPCTNHEHLAHYDALLAPLETWVGAEPMDQVLCQNPERVYGFQAS